MNDSSVVKLGGAASILVGLCHLAITLCALLMPEEQQAQLDVTPHEFWSSLVLYPTAHLTMHWIWAVSGLMGLAAVPAISGLVRSVNVGWVNWASALAYLGFAVNARSHLMEVAFDRKILAIYHLSDPATQKAVHVVAGLALDIPDGFLTYGGIGFWVFIVSFMGLTRRRLPKAIAWIGIATAITYGIGVIGYTFLLRPLLVVSFGVGGLICAPIWFIWIGVHLHRLRLRTPIHP